MLNGLDLFSGIGCMALGLKGFVKPAFYCEIDKYAQQVLSSNMEKGFIEKAQIFNNVREVNKTSLGSVHIDIIYGGFPCQDISSIGKRKGIGGERSGLVSEVYRLVKEIKPAYVLLENVSNIIKNGLENIIKEFTKLGYDCRWDIVSAEMFGAPHVRKRWVFLAKKKNRGNTKNKTEKEQQRGVTDYKDSSQNIQMGNSKKLKLYVIPGTNRKNVERFTYSNGFVRKPLFDRKWYETEPRVARMAHGSSQRIQQSNSVLGNAVPPICIRFAFLKLMLF